jgi:regulator of PEP synthase PpsR (kinase-PPPase family)
VQRIAFVVSDGTGGTAEQLLTAALTQFPSSGVTVVRKGGVRSTQKVRVIVREAEKLGALIVHTLVTDELRALMIRLGRLHNVETIDVMGPLLARLTNRLAVSPAEKPGLFSQLNRDYFRRIEAMEFAIEHDDGRRIEELRRAEIVLVGVSRTFKTPLSIYLAFKGWLVANVPIGPGMEVPPLLLRIPGRRVFGLNTNPRQLSALRRVRSDLFEGALGEYSDFETARQELMYARRLFHAHPEWHIVDVTNKPIEEIASEILVTRPAPRRRTRGTTP